ncbi:hypothetical protein OnM2_03819 [Erysiphe neolycopersici]|uniref:Uncharacterized protein n=1 Tax=Erysiphe neolycopersici TaxID=212602 RepID=A0A420HX86_9PEZI|nr:hypothetical protein OnM2_03819 [Erysiphe neolycopersici]
MVLLFSFYFLSFVPARIVISCFHRLWTGTSTRTPIWGAFWKAARVGERLSPYISVCCIIFALSIF